MFYDSIDDIIDAWMPQYNFKEDTMNTNPVQAAKTAIQTQQVQQKAPPKKEVTKEIGVAYEKSQNVSTNYKMDAKKIQELKLSFSQQTKSFQAMIRKMLEKQGITWHQASNDKDLFNSVVVTPEIQAEAAKNIAENGYWGVEQTSERIISFAKALAGDDPTKIETLKNAFEQGFEQAKKLFGGELPDISQKTYDRVMKGFDEWKNPSEKTAKEV